MDKLTTVNEFKKNTFISANGIHLTKGFNNTYFVKQDGSRQSLKTSDIGLAVNVFNRLVERTLERVK